MTRTQFRKLSERSKAEPKFRRALLACWPLRSGCPHPRRTDSRPSRHCRSQAAEGGAAGFEGRRVCEWGYEQFVPRGCSRIALWIDGNLVDERRLAAVETQPRHDQAVVEDPSLMSTFRPSQRIAGAGRDSGKARRPPSAETPIKNSAFTWAVSIGYRGGAVHRNIRPRAVKSTPGAIKVVNLDKTQKPGPAQTARGLATMAMRRS
jgi:hypothetical protein